MPSKKWKKPKLEDYRIVELTKASQEELSNLPVDLSSTHEELQSRSKLGSLHIHQIVGLSCWNQDFKNGYFLPISCAQLETLFQKKILLTVYGYIVPIMPRSTIVGRKKILAQLVKYEERYRDLSFNAASTYSYQKYAHPQSFNSLLPSKRKLPDNNGNLKRTKILNTSPPALPLGSSTRLMELYEQKLSLVKKIHALEENIHNEHVAATTRGSQNALCYCPFGHKMEFTWGVPMVYQLRGFRWHDRRVFCDGCRKVDIHKGDFYHCKDCRYDYCLECSPKFEYYNKRELDLLKGMVEKHKCHEQTVNWDSVGMEMHEPSRLLQRRYIEATTPAKDRLTIENASLKLLHAEQTQEDEENEEEIKRIVDFIRMNPEAKDHYNFEKLREHPDILMRILHD